MPNEKKDKNIFYFYRKVACVICRKKKRGQGNTDYVVLTKCVTEARGKAVIDYSKTDV